MLKDSKAFSGFSVDDLEKAKEFYGKTLGLDVKLTDMGLDISIPGAHIFAYGKDDHQPATFTILNFPVDDIDKAVDELASKGVKMENYDNMPAPLDDKGILRSPDPKDGPSIAWFKDPAGNVLSVLQN